MILGADGTPQPYLAQSVTPNADYTVWTITLRPNLLFHNGAPCDAAAVAANLERPQGARDSPDRSSPTWTRPSVTSPLAVTVTMKSPWVPFDYYLDRRHRRPGRATSPSPTGSTPTARPIPIGTGPFVFQDWIPNDHFTATRNPHYWRPGLPYLDRSPTSPSPTPPSSWPRLQSGGVDIMHTDTANVTVANSENDTSLGYIDDSANSGR